jgi:hypothetical protein
MKFAESWLNQAMRDFQLAPELRPTITPLA